MKIAILFSVSTEGNFLKDKLSSKKRDSSNLIISDYENHSIILRETGIGKVNAAHSATLVMENERPDLLVSMGIGGAYPETGLEPGGIAIAEKEIYGDEGILTREGFQGMSEIGIPVLKKNGKPFFNEFEADKALVSQALKSISPHFRIRSGTFITLSSCTGTIERSIEIRDRFNALCENMEGAAIAHICTIYSTPFVEIRGVSNIVENRDRSKWKIELAAENCQKAVMSFIEALT